MLLKLRALTGEEEEELRQGLRSGQAFTLRRSQIVLGRARGESVEALSRQVGCSQQTVRNAIRAFNQHGVVCLAPQSNRPKSTAPQVDEAALLRLREMLHQSPRALGCPTGVWTLSLVAKQAHLLGITQEVVSYETIRRALGRVGVSWKRAKAWITSPDPHYALKKSAGRD